MKSFNKKLSILLIAILIWSLFLPWETENTGIVKLIPWFLIIAVGWWFMISGIFIWLTFPFMMVSIISLLNEKYSRALLFSWTSILIWIHTMYSQWKNVNFIDSDMPFWELKIGFYIWIFAIVAFTILCLTNFVKNNYDPTTGIIKWK